MKTTTTDTRSSELETNRASFPGNLRSPVRSASLLAASLLFAFASAGQAASTELSQPYDPAGENYTITALQNLTPVTLTGGTSAGANPNLNFEFQGGLGVRYTNFDNKLVDFGIGLYDASKAKGNQSLSTGLNVTFDQLVSSTGLSATIGDFDISTLSAGFKTGKVSPTVSIYGAGGTLLGNFGASTILADNAMTLISANDPIAHVDTWNLSLEALVGSGTLISGFTLGADTNNGMGGVETGKSDPYFLASVNGGTTVVPEPGSGVLLLMTIVGTMTLTRRRSMFAAI